MNYKNKTVLITGWTEIERFKLYLAAADIAVQLRTMSRGETSAAVLDTMGAGVPTIVNANGSMAELPKDAVWLLDDEFKGSDLIYALESLWADPEKQQDLSSKAKETIKTKHSPTACARLYAETIENYAKNNSERVLAIPSLGQKRYLSAVKHSAAVIGNSSSGIIEVPSFDVATINIGLRQKGRLSAKSVIHCAPHKNDIVNAINVGINKAYKINDDVIFNPYGQGDASGQIVALLKEFKSSTVKSFYDLTVEK